MIACHYKNVSVLKSTYEKLVDRSQTSKAGWIFFGLFVKKKV